ncbi:hypothetical protein [Spongiimicrobium sp. 3-5]|uniref:hypothetical protein n=1 Tax=Spongiimicrobium sp. 3-5 TaxID=3332596 RepID=UPI00397EB6F4
MKQNYLTYIFVFLIAAANGILPATTNAQELKVFTLNDFDLKDSVKSCLVVTDYGKEEFDFNRNGMLTKSVTRYNDSDYDITYYKYNDGDILEKRLENYRDGAFDKLTSIANFYEIDTTAPKKITEKIFSYNKDFLDQYEYLFDEEGKVTRIRRSNNDGNDETVIEYAAYKGETTKTYFLNEVIQKSIRNSTKKSKRYGVRHIRLTKEFLEGQPHKALEEVFDAKEKLVSAQQFVYDNAKKSFVPETLTTYVYDDRGLISKVATKKGDLTETKEYIYQFDNGETGNWIKQIITPDNAYTTRRIVYYEPEEAKAED